MPAALALLAGRNTKLEAEVSDLHVVIKSTQREHQSQHATLVAERDALQERLQAAVVDAARGSESACKEVQEKLWLSQEEVRLLQEKLERMRVTMDGQEQDISSYKVR